MILRLWGISQSFNHLILILYLLNTVYNSYTAKCVLLSECIAGRRGFLGSPKFPTVNKSTEKTSLVIINKVAPPQSLKDSRLRKLRLFASSVRASSMGGKFQELTAICIRVWTAWLTGREFKRKIDGGYAIRATRYAAASGDIRRQKEIFHKTGGEIRSRRRRNNPEFGRGQEDDDIAWMEMKRTKPSTHWVQRPFYIPKTILRIIDTGTLEEWI